MLTTTHAPALAELQRSLAGHILAASDSSTCADNLAWMAESVDEHEKQTRLAVYTSGYPARLVEAMREAYPAVAHLTGAATFAHIVERYSATLPARPCNLNFVGDDLPEFLGEDSLQERLPFLADLARLERAVQRVFHATQSRALDTTTLTDWTADDWENATLQFQPTVACIRSPFPLVELWQARHSPREEIDLLIDQQERAVLVHRSAYDVHCTVIDVREGATLSWLLDGLMLGEVVRRLTGEGHAEAPLGTWLAAWMQQGWLVGCGRG